MDNENANSQTEILDLAGQIKELMGGASVSEIEEFIRGGDVKALTTKIEALLAAIKRRAQN